MGTRETLGFPKAALWACATGAFLRVAAILASPGEGVAYGDLVVYHTTARSLAHSSAAWFDPGGEFGFRPPAYFSYLAVFYHLTGAQCAQLAQLANLLLVPPIWWLIWQLSCRHFGARVATSALWLHATLPVFWISNVLPMSEPLFELLLLGAIHLLLASSAGVMQLACLGILLAIAALTREFAQGLAIIALVAVFVRSATTWDRPIAGPAVVTIAFVVTLAPWMGRNVAVRGSALPLALTSGINLHMGNNPDATGGWAPFRSPEHRVPTDAEFGSADAERWHRNKALEFIRSDPAGFASRAIPKVAHLLWPRTFRDELLEARVFPGFPRALALVLVGLSTCGSAAIWILGSGGVLLRPLDGYGAAVVILFLYTSILCAAAFGAPRFAEPVQVLLLPAAARALSGAGTRERPGAAGKALWLGFLFVLAGLWIFLSYMKLTSP